MNTTKQKKTIKVHDTFVIPNGVDLDKFKKRTIRKKKLKKFFFFLEEFIRKRV